MQPRERIIRERFTEQACGHCQAHYAEESVVVLAHRRSVWMVMASCPQCGRRALYVVSFPDAATHLPARLADTPDSTDTPDAPDLFPGSFLSPDPDNATPSPAVPDVSRPLDPAPLKTPVGIADVNAMHEFLRRFDGDFRSLFAPHPPRRDDASSS